MRPAGGNGSLWVKSLRKENKDESQDQRGSLPCLTSQMGTLKFRPVEGE